MKRTFIMGDIHGNVAPLKEIVQKHLNLFSNSEKHYMILLGDTGLNFGLINKMSKQKKNCQNFLLFILL